MQNDIKRVLAYSTISQLGYMFLGCGVAAYSAAIFHLMTHAFFKALLFLAAGSVIHALGGEQDLRKMGGLRKKIPVTFWTMTVAVFAIAGFFRLPGFFSKDAILYAAFLQGAAGQGALVRRSRNGAAHVVLHVPALVSGLPGRIAQSRCPSAREPVVDAWPARDSGACFRWRRLDRHRAFRRISRAVCRTAHSKDGLRALEILP